MRYLTVERGSNGIAITTARVYDMEEELLEHLESGAHGKKYYYLPNIYEFKTIGVKGKNVTARYRKLLGVG